MFYGIAHRRTLQKAHDEEKIQHAVHDREHLIKEAKAAWKRQQESSKGGGESFLPGVIIILASHTRPVITDPEDPNFDLEKLFAKWEADAQ